MAGGACLQRLKSIMQLGQLLKTDPESCRAWLYGKMLYALLRYAIVGKGRFSPWGYSNCLEIHESLWRELSVALLPISGAERPNIGISWTLSHWESSALLLAGFSPLHSSLCCIIALKNRLVICVWVDTRT